MKDIYEELCSFLVAENKEGAVGFVLNLLENKKIDIIKLYEDVLTPAMNNMLFTEEEQEIAIWKEHVRTAMVRTIVECCYPYVIEKRNAMQKSESKGLVVVLCPPEEYHELGARMAADYFTMCGYQAIFAGSNTPYQDIYHAMTVLKPSFIAISVSDYYNLVITKKMIEQIKDMLDYPVKIIVGGHVFRDDRDNYKLVGADYYAYSYKDIEKITGSEVAK